MKNEGSEGRRAIAKAILEQYQPTTVQEMQEALRDIFGPMFEAILQREMEGHLGYESIDRGAKRSANRRNGYTRKTVNQAWGILKMRTPRDRDGSFKLRIIPKRAKDISGIEDKVLLMYARGLSQRDIAETIEDIYGFEISVVQFLRFFRVVRVDQHNMDALLLHQVVRQCFPVVNGDARLAKPKMMKCFVWACVINGFAWMWCSYILAALDKAQIAEELSKVVLVAVYAPKSVAENLSKNNCWPEKATRKECGIT